MEYSVAIIKKRQNYMDEYETMKLCYINNRKKDQQC